MREAPAYVPLTAPRAHQARELTRSLDKPAFALFMDPGTGKTWVALQTVGHWYMEKNLRTVVVVCPNGVQEVWDEQIAAHLSPVVLRRVLRYESRKKLRIWDDLNTFAIDARDFRRRGFLPPLLFVYVNVEAVSVESGQAFLRELLTRAGKRGGVGLIIDESHTVKRAGAARTRALRQLAKLTQLRRILTGTPWPHGYEDAYPQYAILDPKILGCNTKAEFVAEYCIERKFARFSKVVGYRNTDRLIARIAPYTAFAKLEECMDLPPVQGGVTGPEPLIRWCDLLPEQSRIYHAVRLYFLAELDKGATISAPEAIVRLLRLQQIIGGGTKTDAGDFHVFPSATVATAVEILQEVPPEHKALVWCRFKHEAEAVTTALTAAGIPAVAHTGDSDQETRAQIRKQWQGSKTLRVLVPTYATAGAGFTLIDATVAVFLSNSFQYDHRFQAERRNLRIGQSKPVLYYDIMARNTITARIFRVLRSRRSLDRLIDLAPAAELRQLLQDEVV